MSAWISRHSRGILGPWLERSIADTNSQAKWFSRNVFHTAIYFNHFARKFCGREYFSRKVSAQVTKDRSQNLKCTLVCEKISKGVYGSLCQEELHVVYELTDEVNNTLTSQQSLTLIYSTSLLINPSRDRINPGLWSKAPNKNEEGSRGLHKTGLSFQI